jgi:hypothetical protein
MVAAGNPQVAAVMVVSPLVVASASQQEWRVRHALDASGAGTGAGPVSRYYAVAADAGKADLRVDPAQPWRRVAQPVLAAWGAADAVVPARASAERLRAALADGGVNRDRTFRTFAGASHTLGVASESGRAGSAPGFMALSAQWLRAHLDPKRAAAPVVATPLPPDAPPEVHAVQSASLFERWPLQLAWLALPALALMLIAARAWRRRDEEDAPLPTALEWWWLGGVLALDALALLALAFAVASLIDVDGRGVAAVAGVPVVVAVTWVLVLAGVVATALLIKRARRRTPASGVCLASCAWLALALYWLV